MAEYQRDYETERRVLEKDPDVTGKDKLGAEYNRVTEEFTVLEVELQGAEEKLSGCQAMRGRGRCEAQETGREESRG